MQPLNGIGGPRRAPLAWRQAGEGEQPVSRFLQAIGHGAMLQPPLAQEDAPARLDLARALGVDHVRLVGRDLLMQPLRGVRQKVAVLMHDPNAISVVRFTVTIPFAGAGRLSGPRRRDAHYPWA